MRAECLLFCTKDEASTTLMSLLALMVRVVHCDMSVTDTSGRLEVVRVRLMPSILHKG